MSTWQQAGSDAGNGGYLAGQWPTFWAGAVTGWTGLFRVDNATCIWMGQPTQTTLSVNQTTFEYTSTRSTFTMDVLGQVQMKITFLSPVAPDDLLRSSLPYSYMEVDVQSVDGKQHDVQIYTDISAEQEQQESSEINQQAEWGNWFYSTSNVESLTHQSGADATVRSQFVTNGYLANTADTDYRPVNQDYVVFGFSRDLGSVGSTSQSMLFQLSLHQQNAMQFLGANGLQAVPSLWTSYFSSDTDAESSSATSLDNKIASDSVAAGGQDYLNLTSLATRQAFGALEGTNTPTEPWVFLKEISSDGNVQTVDVIFPFHPIAIYLNPSILKYLLDPLFIQQEAGNFPQANTEDWELFCAAIASQDTKTEFISTVAKWLGVTPTNFAFTDLYDTVTGNYPPGITFIARPVVGGLYSLLALKSAPSNGYVAA
nr:hypothetical protein B0A51_01907 [Rachicladosporium sp. CCFEE 5018]